MVQETASSAKNIGPAACRDAAQQLLSDRTDKEHNRKLFHHQDTRAGDIFQPRSDNKRIAKL